MPPSNSSRGARYKQRSKEWCEKRGYPVATMELQRVVHTANGIFPKKQDQWGSDWQYLTPDGAVFLQTKGGGTPTAKFLAQAQEAFNQHRFPASVRLEVHIWRPRARAPEIHQCQIKNIL